MCYFCYEEYGKPEIVNDKTIKAAELTDQVYEWSRVGGNCHIIVDDFNVEDDHVDFSIKQVKENPLNSPECQLLIESELLELLKDMTVDERASALAIHEGWLRKEAS